MDRMLQSTVSRVRLALSALGFIVLCASLFTWVQSHGAREQYTWVDAGASDAPALDTAEIWQVSATCARPYFIKAALRSKAKLKAYYDLAPEAVRARLNRSSAIPRSATPKNRYRLIKDQPGQSTDNDDTDLEYSALLHVQYAEWYANVFKLEIEANQWQQRLIGVTDQRLMLSGSARKSFGAYSRPDTGALGATSGFDSQVLATLGLSGFPRHEEQALKTDCIKISLVNKVLTTPNYIKELWRWPVEQTAAFALALELILLGIFLVPMTLLIGTGDPRLAAQHVRDTATRVRAKVKSFNWKKRVFATAKRIHAVRIAAQALLAELGARLRPIVEELIVLFLRWVVLPGIALSRTLWSRCAALLRRHVRFQDSRHGLDLVARILRQARADRTA